MKKALLKFADNLLSKQEMKGIKGGIVYCMKNGQFWGTFDSPQAAEAAVIADQGSGTYDCFN